MCVALPKSVQRLYNRRGESGKRLYSVLVLSFFRERAPNPLDG
ncbi:hypothetical protein ACP70R_031442 [Stipagrostis hirtigluma subsp. patula]